MTKEKALGELDPRDPRDQEKIAFGVYLVVISERGQYPLIAAHRDFLDTVCDHDAEGRNLSVIRRTLEGDPPSQEFKIVVETAWLHIQEMIEQTSSTTLPGPPPDPPERDPNYSERKMYFNSPPPFHEQAG